MSVTSIDVPLVLLHAFPLSAAMWRHQVSGLADLCPVFAVDQRGFGTARDVSLEGVTPSLDVVADDLAGYLDERGLNQVVLGGLSMGGYVAMAFLRRHPDRVRGLILADTKATADTPEAARDRLRIAEAIEREGDTESLAATMLPRLLGASTRNERPDVVDWVTTEIRGAAPAAVAWAQRAMAARPDSLETLAAADVPALVLVGEEDETTGIGEARTMVEVLPRAELRQIPRAGHLSAVEAPEEFNAAVRDFLTRLR